MTNAKGEKKVDTKYGRCMTTTAAATALKIMQNKNKIMMHAWRTKSHRQNNNTIEANHAKTDNKWQQEWETLRPR